MKSRGDLLSAWSRGPPSGDHGGGSNQKGIAKPIANVKRTVSSTEAKILRNNCRIMSEVRLWIAVYS